MKKKMFIAVLAMAMTLQVTACNSSNGETGENSEAVESSESAEDTENTENAEDTETTENGTEESTEESTESSTASSEPYSEAEYTALDYVTLGDYSSFDVSIDESSYVVSESDVNDLIDEMIDDAGAYEDDDTQDTVLEDSVIRADYVGTIDGEEFDGGSATDNIIDVANNMELANKYSYIEGFTDGLPGAKVGETVDCTVTFPEDYTEEDLAGKEAVFTFTINAIEKVYTHENIDDEYVSEKLGYNTVDALKVAANESVQTNTQNTRKNDIQTQCIEQLMERSEINGFPEDMIDTRFEYSYNRLENSILSYYSMTIEQYAAYQGMTLDEYKEYLKSEIETSAKQEMLLKAICETENMEIDDSGFSEFVTTLLTTYDYESSDELYAAYDADYVEYSYLIKKAKDLLYDNATVTDSATTESTEETETAETEAAE
ncbi:MAG: FKBP-type peptidyl-prolyl cis-trans isomerase [Lachnospiraceae bacterium]|nr:FKBP-type peptidyl-prolyl cis-trans isomerase [Lachnospiraceae bacterium]